MFMITLSKKSVQRVGVIAACALVVGAVAVGVRYRQVQRASAQKVDAVRIESAEDVQTYFLGFGLEVDLASITVDEVEIPRKWDDQFSAFHALVAQSGLSLKRNKGDTVEKWTACLPSESTGEQTRYAILLVRNHEAVGAYLVDKPSGAVTGIADAVQARVAAPTPTPQSSPAPTGQVQVQEEGAAQASADEFAPSASDVPLAAPDAQANLDVELVFDEEGFPVE